MWQASPPAAMPIPSSSSSTAFHLRPLSSSCTAASGLQRASCPLPFLLPTVFAPSLSLSVFVICLANRVAWILVLGWQFRRSPRPAPPTRPTPPTPLECPCPSATRVLGPQMSGAPSSWRVRRSAALEGVRVCSKAFASTFRILALPSLPMADPRHVPSLVAVLLLAAGPQHVPSPLALPLPVPLVHSPIPAAIPVLV